VQSDKYFIWPSVIKLWQTVEPFLPERTNIEALTVGLSKSPLKVHLNCSLASFGLAGVLPVVENQCEHLQTGQWNKYIPSTLSNFIKTLPPIL